MPISHHDNENNDNGSGGSLTQKDIARQLKSRRHSTWGVERSTVEIAAEHAATGGKTENRKQATFLDTKEITLLLFQLTKPKEKRPYRRPAQKVEARDEKEGRNRQATLGNQTLTMTPSVEKQGLPTKRRRRQTDVTTNMSLKALKSSGSLLHPKQGGEGEGRGGNWVSGQATCGETHINSSKEKRKKATQCIVPSTLLHVLLFADV